MRLNKYLASAGISSRRGADELIREGRIEINGKVMRELGKQIDPEKDVIKFDGKSVSQPEEKEYWIVNKPLGVVSTARDTHGRKTVVELVKTKARLYPVGRLDENSHGLILLTNDGELALKLTHPKFGVEKVYEVKVEGNMEEKKIQQLKSGVKLDDGWTRPAGVERIGFNQLKFTLKEGRKRQIRRMCQALGLEVVDLKRIKMGGLELGKLAEGKAKKLEEREVMDLLK